MPVFGERRRKNLAYGSPNTANRIGTLTQVCLLKLLKGAVLSSVPSGDHGEVGGKLEHIASEALLSDPRTALGAQLTKPKAKVYNI